MYLTFFNYKWKIQVLIRSERRNGKSNFKIDIKVAYTLYI